MGLIFLLFGAIFAGVIITKMITEKIRVDWSSFLKATIPLDTGVFGVYCFTGHQGSGKTYSLNKFIRKHAKGKRIYSNMTLRKIDYTPIESVEHLFSLIDQEDCYIIYDEIFTVMSKSKRLFNDAEEFLSQMRKQRIIFITTAQYWLTLDVDFRRFVRIQVECETRPLGKLGGILKESYFDASKMKWSNLDNEYISPIIATKYSKYEKKYMELYDTHERIRTILKTKKA